MDKLKEFFTSSKMKTFYWQTGNGFLVILIGTLTAVNPDTLDPKMVFLLAGILSVLNIATKFINQNYIK